MAENFSIKPSDMMSENGGSDVPRPPRKVISSGSDAAPGLASVLAKSKPKQGEKKDIFEAIGFGGIPIKDIVFFTREFSILLNASVPLTESIRILTEQTKNPKLRKTIQRVGIDIDGGDSLSAAMAKHPKVFDTMFVNLIRTGEASGTLDKSLNYIADQQEKDYNLRRKVKGAMSYPIFVMSAMVLILGLLFAFVMPRMLGMLTENGTELPITTKMLVFVTGIISGYWWLILLLVGGGYFAFQRFVSTRSGRLWWDNTKLRIPGVGKLIQNVYVERFARNFAILIQGGVPIVSALKVTAGAIGSTAYERVLLQVAKDVENGSTLSESLSRHPKEIPVLIAQMVDVGEKTSKIDEILIKVATFFERETDVAVGSMTQLLEPLIMVILGVVVSIIVAGILLPIYSMVTST